MGRPCLELIDRSDDGCEYESAILRPSHGRIPLPSANAPELAWLTSELGPRDHGVASLARVLAGSKHAGGRLLRTGNMTLNVSLGRAPRNCIEYVVRTSCVT